MNIMKNDIVLNLSCYNIVCMQFLGNLVVRAGRIAVGLASTSYHLLSTA
jgi:hypothetical protein